MVNPDTRRKIFFTFLLFAVFCLVAGNMVYMLFGHRVIADVYSGRSISILNSFIEGQKLHPVEFYLQNADYVFFVLNLTLLAGLFFIFFIFERKIFLNMANTVLFKNRRLSACIFILAVIALAFILRLPSYNKSVINWDESVYLLVGDNILHGGAPYKEIWDNKGPLLYFIFAFVIKTMGHSIIGLRIFTTLWVTVTAFLIFFVGHRVYNRTSGIFASLFFIVSSSVYSLGGLASNSEIFYILPVLAGAYLILFNNASIKNMLLAGFLVGLAFIIKSMAIFDFAAFLFFIFLIKMTEKDRFFESIKNGFFCLLGFLAPIFAAVLYFQSKGMLNDFITVYFNNSLYYAACLPSFFTLVKALIFTFLPNVFSSLWFICILSLAAILSYALGLYGKCGKIKFIVIWLFFIFAGIITHHRFRNHMFIQMLPPFCLLGGVGIAKLISLEKNKLTFVFLALYVSLGFICSVRENIKDFIKMDAFHKKIELDDTPSRISGYLKGRLSPLDYIYVTSYKMPIIYFLTDAKVPGRYVNPHILSAPQIYEKMLGMDVLEELKKMLNKNPAYIVLRREGEVVISKKVDAYLAEYIQKHYSLEKTIDDTYIYRLLTRTGS